MPLILRNLQNYMLKKIIKSIIDRIVHIIRSIRQMI